MFDRYDFGRRVPDVRVTLNQQPNDAADSARLYGELKRKAEAEVSDAQIVKFGARNELTGVIVRTDKRYYDGVLHVRLIFQLNGEKYDFYVEDEIGLMSREANREILLRVVSKALDKMGSFRP